MGPLVPRSRCDDSVRHRVVLHGHDLSAMAHQLKDWLRPSVRHASLGDVPELRYRNSTDATRISPSSAPVMSMDALNGSNEKEDTAYLNANSNPILLVTIQTLCVVCVSLRSTYGTNVELAGGARYGYSKERPVGLYHYLVHIRRRQTHVRIAARIYLTQSTSSPPVIIWESKNRNLDAL